MSVTPGKCAVAIVESKRAVEKFSALFVGIAAKWAQSATRNNNAQLKIDPMEQMTRQFNVLQYKKISSIRLEAALQATHFCELQISTVYSIFLFYGVSLEDFGFRRVGSDALNFGPDMSLWSLKVCSSPQISALCNKLCEDLSVGCFFNRISQPQNCKPKRNIKCES